MPPRRLRCRRARLRFHQPAKWMRNRPCWILDGIAKVVGDVPSQLGCPIRLPRFVNDYTQMPKVERHIFNLRSCQDNWFLCCVGKTKFIEHIRVLVCEVREQYARLSDLLPDLLNNAPRAKELVSPHWFAAM